MKHVLISVLLILASFEVNPRTREDHPGDSYHERVLNISCSEPVADTLSDSRNRSHMISLYTGCARHVERDDAISPFMYKGFTLPVEIRYDFRFRRSNFLFSVFYDHLMLDPFLPYYGASGPRYYTSNTNFAISSFYTRNIISATRQNLDIYFGGGLDLLVNFRSHFIEYPGGTNNYLMLDQFNSLAFMLQGKKKLVRGNGFLSAGISFPAISYVIPGEAYNAYVGKAINDLMNSDRNVLSDLFKNGEWVSFKKLVKINADISYARLIGNHLGFGLRYSFQYYRFTQFHDMNYSENLQGCLLFGVIIKL